MSENAANTIAFIGLGVMGYPMAKNLRRKIGHGKAMVICDIENAVLQRFKSENSEYGAISIASNAAEAIKAADTLISVLPSESALKSIYLDPTTGILATLQPTAPTSPKTLIECGTVSSLAITSVASTFAPIHNVTFIDAPISGGPMGSEAGTLSFMVGCPSPTVFQTIKSDLLVHMGSANNIFHCGPVGTGTAFKIINNYISLVSVVSVSEAYNIAQRLGLDMGVLTELLGSGSAQCWVVSKNNPVPGIHPHAPASHGYAGGFRLELAEKVLSLGQELAESVGAETVLDKAALEVFRGAAADPRYMGKDARVVYKYLVDKE